MTNEERQQAIEWLKRRPVMMAGAKRMYDLAVEALEAYVPDKNVGKWIPVSEKEKLPENGRKVLVKADDVYYSMGQQNGVVIGWRNGNYWYTYTIKGEEYIRYPSKWMPLPEPYKEGERNGQE